MILNSGNLFKIRIRPEELMPFYFAIDVTQPISKRNSRVIKDDNLQNLYKMITMKLQTSKFDI